MSKTKFLISTLVMVLGAAGCSQLLEVPKFFWGSSTKALEKGRATAIQKTYRCTVNECFDTVLKLTQRPKEDYGVSKPGTPTVEQPRATSLLPPTPITSLTSETKTDTPQAIVAPATVYLDLYIKDRKKNLIVVMGIPNCVNTTEVGIFFTSLDQGNIKIELSSLSTKAKKAAAEIVFAELNKHFPEIK